ncbi:hypothetical protein [Aequorivita antarctica]|uniref:Uncharacterized protein n=1 Tax=Aequorivita antarctica TaxID=153266 RepID=A0A5C6YWD5_9FLAO|nr:hypothetical protein [Aequorivita antarctica]TXD71345.1 hypothetical protein ESU54_17010 [Aequorivita antarctica]SRX76162.1 hypothetical protein AEQU3_03160 [Aequorivita antarctica]
METNIKRVIQNLSFFSILIVFTFSLLSFNTKSATSTTLENNSITEKQTTIVITKKTTLEELQKIKKQMKDEGLGFDYSNVVYNKKNEIISITIRYKDANNNSGNYSVSSQNPINDIVIISEGTRLSVTSAGSSNQSFISQGNGGQVSSNAEKSYNDRSEAMRQRSEQMEKEMEDKMNAMKERQAEMMNRMQQRRDSISTLNQPTVKSATNFNGRSHLITKNTTNSELLELQNSYDAENISFYYKNLERNDSNEITHISITIDNRNGSVSTSRFGNSKEAIKDIIVAADKQHSIMKSAE